MTNDTTTLNGALTELGETMADNLVSMGVSGADASDGLTTLAGKILDIDTGLDFNTNITIDSSDDFCLPGSSITFEAKLTATSDDAIDVNAVLSGATVKFKNGNTVIGTATTDSNGIAYYTHTFNTIDEYSITAIFEGTDDFDACTSSSTTVIVNYDLSILSDMDIISYDDSDVANITINLHEENAGIPDKIIEYEIKYDSIVISSDSDVTDNIGNIHLTYPSRGIGEITITASYENIEKTYTIYDVLKYDNGKLLSDYNDIWSLTSGASLVRADSGTILSETTSSNVAASTSISSNTIIDFEIYQVDGGTNRAFAHISQNSTARVTVMLDDILSSASTGMWYKLQLIVTSDNLRAINLETGDYVDKSITASYNSFRLVTGNEITSLMFRNVLIYQK